MYLVSAKVGPFKSINTPQDVRVEETVTVLVGMNEAGKTVFLQALEKSQDVHGRARFNPVDDYPRKDLPSYLRQHKTEPACATLLTYRLDPDELAELNTTFHTALSPEFHFSVLHHYDNKTDIQIEVDERPALAAMVSGTTLSSDALSAAKTATSLRQLVSLLEAANLTDADKAFASSIQARAAKTDWECVIEWEVWNWLSVRTPKFLYFSEYDLLPSKVNLQDLRQRLSQINENPRALTAAHRAVLALLRLADISVEDFTTPRGYEELKAKIEGVSINLTDKIMEFWKQNEDLEVEVDIKDDPSDESPYNGGANLYLRIKNRRHRGVSTQFGQRSRGFIWFFSFLVWFDSVQQQLDSAAKAHEKNRLILLLDEPGLALHALAQADFLRYIDDLAGKHQVLYTTHSPFMIHPDRLHQIRIVEDRAKVGTVITDTVSGSDARTLFPLQAALGWTIAQNLFISPRNLLVEGPSDLLYLKVVSAILATQGRTALRDDITIVPTGGLDKVVTFVALLGAHGLQLAVLHDYRGTPEQKLMDLVRQKLISAKFLLNAAQFRDPGHVGVNQRASDIEDLLDAATYLCHFQTAFSKALKGQQITESDLPAGDRIIARIERWLESRNIKLRPSGGFNHYTVASAFASSAPMSLDDGTLKRFEELFATVNSLFDSGAEGA